MSYTLTLQCGCVVYMACHPKTREVHTRIIEARSQRCGVRRHEVGLRLELRELLGDPDYWRGLAAVTPPMIRSGRA